MQRFTRTFCLVILLGAAAASGLAAQSEDGLSRRAPRFLLASASAPRPVPVEPSRTPVLRERISVDLPDATLGEALATIAGHSGLRLLYSSGVVPLERRVRLRAQDITVAAALTEVLLDTGVDVLFTGSGQAVLVKREPEPAPPQAGVIAGTVRGAETAGQPAQPVPGAQVVVEGANLSALTDDEGRFRIAGVPAGIHTVAVSSLGWRRTTREVEVPEGATVTVEFVLDAAPTRLAEVVVTATGPQRRVELGHVVDRIDAEAVMRDAPVNSFTDLITARAAGVQVLHQSGVVGSTPRIRIRGLNSTSLSNDPIIVVDGVRVDNSIGPATGTGIALRGGRLNDLNPEEIESLEIAKGPTAAALYGTDAANGVIVVTTKRGRPGPARWRAWTGQSWATKAVDEFTENYMAWGHTAANPTVARRCTLQDLANGVCEAVDSISHFNPLNHPETTPFTTGHRQEYGLQVSGGTDRLTYLFSGQLSDEDGYVRMPRAEAERFEALHGPGTLLDDFLRPNGQQRVSLRVNVNAALDDRTDLDARVNYIRNDTRFITDGGGGGVITSAVRGPGYRDEQNGYSSTTPPAQTFATKRDETVNRFVTSLTARWRPTDWLSFRGTAGLDHISSDRSGLSRAGEGEPPAQGVFDHVLLGGSNYTADLAATATAPLSERWTSATAVGVQYTRTNSTELWSRALGLPPGGTGNTGGTTNTIRSTRSESYVLGAYVQQQLALNNRLFLIAALRGDGGSAFGDDVSLAAYPKASASWLVSEEPFMPRIDALTSLRLRAAWGASGVQPRRADVIPSYAYGTAVVDGQVVNSALLNQIGNPDLKPERQRELELGLDVELFGSRVGLEATYYNRVSHDALVTVDVLPSHGSFTRLENLGSVRNRGVEGSLRLGLVDTRPVRWDVIVGGSYNQNRLLELAPGITTLDAASRHRHVEGFPIWGMWERTYTYEDANGDGIIVPAEIQVSDTAVYIGPSHAPRELTVASSVELLDGRIRLGALLDRRSGHFRMDNNAASRCITARSCRGVNDPTAPLAEQAAAVAMGLGAQSVLPIHDASFTRLRELSLTYTADPRVARLFGGREVSITLAARNLGLWTDYPGDPEGSTLLFSSAGADAYSDNGAFPQARSFALRVQIGN